MNNTCRYRLKCQPEYKLPFHYICRGRNLDVFVECGFGRCRGRTGWWQPLIDDTGCETTAFSVPIEHFFGGVLWHVYLYRTEEDRSWGPEQEGGHSLADPEPKKRWFVCCANGQNWVWPKKADGSVDDEHPIFDLDPEWLGYPAPGP